jgi:hypothetical protein
MIEKIEEAKDSYFKQQVRFFLEQRKWWIMPMLLIFILATLVTLYLLKYKNTDFIYSLF